MNTASISLLLKSNKDPTLPSSYRPISLLNVDIKIITKTLSHRLEKIIPSIIHPDQTGLIKGRNSSNNTRRLFNIMHRSATHHHNSILATLDAEKLSTKLTGHSSPTPSTVLALGNHLLTGSEHFTPHLQSQSLLMDRPHKASFFTGGPGKVAHSLPLCSPFSLNP